MSRYYVKVEYQYFSKTNKPGRELYQEKTYSTKKRAMDFVKRIKKEKEIEFKRYNGKMKNFKYKIIEVK